MGVALSKLVLHVGMTKMLIFFSESVNIWASTHHSDVLCSLRPHVGDDWVWRAVHQAFEVLEECVSVLLQETLDAIHYITCIVPAEQTKRIQLNRLEETPNNAMYLCLVRWMKADSYVLKDTNELL